MKKILSLFVLLFSFFVFSANVQAQGYQEVIRSFDSDIRLGSDNVAHITETIVYDFSGNSKRGIYREIPKTTKAGDTGQYYYYELDWVSVTQDGAPAEILIQDTDDNANIRIGNPDIYLSGPHTYEISYTLSPIAEQDEAGDYINLNITGNGWAALINEASVKITLDKETSFIGSRCYAGITSSVNEICDIKKKDNVLNASVTDLGSYQGMTINALTDQGAFTTYQAPQDPPPFDWRPAMIISIGIFGFIIGILLNIYRWLSYRRTRKDQTIIPMYDPPKDLSVGEIGLLHDNTSNMNEITAMLIQLAVDGYIKIENTKEKSFFSKAQYKFHKLKDYSGSDKNQKRLFNMLFSGKKATVNLSSVSRTKASKAVTGVKSDLVDKLESKGYRYKDAKGPIHKKIVKLFQLVAVVIVGASAFYAVKLIMESENFAPAGISAAISLMLAMFGYLFSKRVEISPTGYRKWGEIEGLIMYLTVAEKDRLAFHNAPKMNVEHFSALLPVAVALGVDDVWAKQFESLDVQDQVDWYSGANRFNTVGLSRSLAHDMNSTINSSFSPPTQSSSGGFSGGGFSGGGGGGGGGGSW